MAAQVYDALSYYHDNQEEIEKDIRERGGEIFYHALKV